MNANAYVNLTEAWTHPAERHIRRQWVAGLEVPNPSFLHKEILSRGGHLLLAPATALTCALDTIIGLGTGLAAILTFGLHSPTSKFAASHLKKTNGIVAQPYQNLLRTLNPAARFERDAREGFLTPHAKGALMDLAGNCSNSDNILKRHVAARLTYALQAVALIITRIVDATIGIPAAALSLLTYGTVYEVNVLAFHGLQAPGVVNDLFFCTARFINPWVEL